MYSFYSTQQLVVSEVSKNKIINLKYYQYTNCVIQCQSSKVVQEPTNSIFYLVIGTLTEANKSCSGTELGSLGQQLDNCFFFVCVFLTWYLTVLSIGKSLFSLCNNKCFVGRYYETIKKSSFSHLCPFLTPIDNSCLEQLLLHLSNGNSLFPSFLLHLIRILLQERAFPSRSFICLFNYLFISV